MSSKLVIAEKSMSSKLVNAGKRVNKCYQWTVDRLFESKKFMKICSKTHQIASFKKMFAGKHAPKPP